MTRYNSPRLRPLTHTSEPRSTQPAYHVLLLSITGLVGFSGWQAVLPFHPVHHWVHLDVGNEYVVRLSAS